MIFLNDHTFYLTGNGSSGHKSICVTFYKRQKDVAIAAEKALKAKGVDVRGRRTQAAFYHDNPAVFQSVKATGFGYEDYSYQILRGDNVNLGQLFMNYRATAVSVKLLGDMAREQESYYGLEMTLDAYLDVILDLQPYFMYLRSLVPLMMIQLGRDDEAYNFIKFWLKHTPKSSKYHISEDGVFMEEDLPFIEYTMKDQDKNEDIFEVLGIGSEQPYFIYVTFFISLAIIKKNNFEATKDEKQMEHFKKTLNYIKCHFKGLVKKGLDIKLIDDAGYPCSGLAREPMFTRIPACYGMQKGKYPTTAQVEEWAADFFDNFLGDLDTYLDRKKGLREEMLKYL